MSKYIYIVFVHIGPVYVFSFSGFMRELHWGQTWFYTSNKDLSETFIVS